MSLLQLLKSLFGQKYLNKIIGTRTNVVKPIKMDKNSPFKEYSDTAFDDPKVLSFIEKKIDEYGAYALNNKNPQELANFESNAKRLLAAKNKQTGTTGDLSDLMKMTDDDLNALAKEGNDLKAKRILTGDDRERLSYIDNILEEAQKLPDTGKGLAEDIKAAGGKPEADIVDISTQQKVDDTGIMKLKTELGLPEGVEPGSTADKAIKESVQYKMDQQGVKKVLDKDYVPPKTTSIDEDEIADVNLKKDIAKLNEREARAYSANIESYRRPIIRQMLLKDTKINLPDDVRKSLENKADLQRGADPKMDPLRLLDEYYDWDMDKLDELEEIRFTAKNEFEAADEFLKKGGLKPKELGDKLKDYDGDPDALAEGGRPGFKFGTGKEGIKGILKTINKKFGKDTIKTADQIKLTDDMINERESKRAFQDLELLKDAAPKFYLRMTLKLKYPGITDDLIEKIMADDDPQRIAEVMATMDESFKMMDKGMDTDQIINTFQKTPRTKQADGGLNYLMGL